MLEPQDCDNRIYYDEDNYYYYEATTTTYNVDAAEEFPPPPVMGYDEYRRQFISKYFLLLFL